MNYYSNQFVESGGSDKGPSFVPEQFQYMQASTGPRGVTGQIGSPGPRGPPGENGKLSSLKTNFENIY